MNAGPGRSPSVSPPPSPPCSTSRVSTPPSPRCAPVSGPARALFSGRERTRALGAYATVGGLAGVVGPLVGGTLIGALGPEHGWRFVLLLNLPFGLLTVPLAVKWLPATRPPRAGRASLDLPGLALLAAATLCLLLPFVLPQGVGPPPVTWLIAAPALAAVLIGWERRYAGRGNTPILLPALVRSRGFGLGTLVAMFQFGASLSASLALTLFLQDGLGWTALHAALTLLPSALGFAVASALSWRVVSRYGRISVVWALIGSLVTIAATVVVILRVPADRLGLALTLTQLAMGITGGLIISPNQALTLAHGPARSAGLASGFLQLAQRISATVTMAAVSGVVLGVTAGSARWPVAHGLIICGVMLVLAAAVAAADCRTPPPVAAAPEPVNKAVIHT